MLATFVLLICIPLITTRIDFKDFNVAYLNKENTSSLKGIFIVLVFLSHMRTYVEFSWSGDIMVINLLDSIGQLMVTLFLFISGYGVYESIKYKGQNYIRRFPKNRIGKTFFDFCLAIISFIFVDLIVGRELSFSQIALSFTGWTSIGNSNWYMFAIFCLYITTFISFIFTFKNKIISLCIFTFLSLCYVYILSQVQPDRFSNTYLCYAAGMWYSYFKVKIDIIFEKNTFYWSILLILAFLFIFIFPYREHRILYYNVVSIVFCILVTIVMMRLTFRSKILKWFGDNLFWVYILQRIPMILLAYSGVSDPYVFLLLSLMFTVMLVKVFSVLSDKTKQIIFA